MNEKHYPDVDTDAPKSEQAADATKQFFGTLRGRIGVLFGHIGLVAMAALAYQKITSSVDPEPQCTAGELVCAFSGDALDLPMIAIAGSPCAMIVAIYWTVRMRD